MKKAHNNQSETFRINLIDLDMSAPEAKNLLLKLVNNRIDFHNQENFSSTVRNAKSTVDHSRAVLLLQEAKRQLNTALLRALDSGYRINVTGNLIISLLDEQSRNKLV